MLHILFFIFLLFFNGQSVVTTEQLPVEREKFVKIHTPAPAEVSSNTPSLTIHDVTVFVEIAETDTEKARGLSGRASLPWDHGMLFLYDTPGQYTFWMKEMYFPIDIFWIGSDKTIVDITHDLSPTTYPSTVQPKKSAQYVLEVNAGWAEAHGIQEGEHVQFDSVLNDPGKSTMSDAPFIVQAPQGRWDDSRQQDACEEVTALMAVRWARGEGEMTPVAAEEKILKIVAYEQERYGTHEDTSVTDTVERIFNGYFRFPSAQAKSVETIDDIIHALDGDHVVIVPTDGRALENPFYTPPGPERHMLVILGYDPATKEFITNDPGTRRGRAYRYAADILFDAIRDYPSGDHIPIISLEKNMILVSREE